MRRRTAERPPPVQENTGHRRADGQDPDQEDHQALARTPTVVDAAPSTVTACERKPLTAEARNNRRPGEHTSRSGKSDVPIAAGRPWDGPTERAGHGSCPRRRSGREASTAPVAEGRVVAPYTASFAVPVKPWSTLAAGRMSTGGDDQVPARVERHWHDARCRAPPPPLHKHREIPLPGPPVSRMLKAPTRGGAAR
jgi:hypothetical protein